MAPAESEVEVVWGSCRADKHAEGDGDVWGESEALFCHGYHRSLEGFNFRQTMFLFF